MFVCDSDERLTGQREKSSRPEGSRPECVTSHPGNTASVMPESSRPECVARWTGTDGSFRVCDPGNFLFRQNQFIVSGTQKTVNLVTVSDHDTPATLK